MVPSSLVVGPGRTGRFVARGTPRPKGFDRNNQGLPQSPTTQSISTIRNPTRAIANYLWSVADEAKERGYHFDVSKIAAPRRMFTIPVTKGQLAYELAHLKQKLRQRDPKQFQLVNKREPVKVNSTFKAMEGPMAPWERTPKDRAGRAPERVTLVQAKGMVNRHYDHAQMCSNPAPRSEEEDIRRTPKQ
jgi:hypothetical protein